MKKLFILLIVPFLVQCSKDSETTGPNYGCYECAVKMWEPDNSYANGETTTVTYCDKSPEAITNIERNGTGTTYVQVNGIYVKKMKQTRCTKK
jgi:hypothetical protein